MEQILIEIKLSVPNGSTATVEVIDSIKKNDNETMGLALSAIARHGKEYNRTWVEKHFGPLEDFDGNPGALLKQVKELMGW